MADIVKFVPKAHLNTEAQEQSAEAAQRGPEIGDLQDWLEVYGWYGLMILSYERGIEPFADQGDLAEWAQQNWYGSDAFSSAPFGELDWHAANDAISHWVGEYEFDLKCLNAIVASALAHR